MITIAEYFDVVRSACKNPSAVSGLYTCFPKPDQMQDLREMVEEFGLDPDGGREGLVEIYPLAEAHAAFGRSGFKCYNWHYDRVAGYVIMNLRKGVHEHLSAALWQCAHPEFTQPFVSIDETEDMAEKFIEEGLGFFRSTASYGRAMKGKDVKLTAQEKTVFGIMFHEL